MARPRAEKYRDPSEYAGYTFIPCDLLCPKCKGATRVLVTPKRGNSRGIECTECSWSQYPGNAPTLGSTAESRRIDAAWNAENKPSEKDARKSTESDERSSGRGKA